MDIVTYAILKKKLTALGLKVEQVEAVVSALPPGYAYKGSVEDTSSLPDDAELGDLYTVGSNQYVWDGTDWVEIYGGLATEADIDALFE